MAKHLLLFENKNAADLARKISILIDSADLRKKLSAASRTRAIENFDLEVLTEKVIEIYKSAI